MKTIKIVLLCHVIALLGCGKFTEVPKSANLIENNMVFQNEQAVLSALYGVYTQIRLSSPAMLNGGMSIFSGLLSGELKPESNSATYIPFYNNLVLSDNGTISSTMWSVPYNVIYRINAILQGMENSHSLSPAFVAQIKGELLVSRSLLYFYLVNLYGDVPLLLTSDYTQTMKASRTPITQCYQKLTDDLTLAASLLQPNYPTAAKQRPNRYTALALLSRVYLYTGKWEQAEKTVDLILESQTYKLAALADVFKPNSSETIWEIGSDTRNTAEGITFIPAFTTARPLFSISKELIESFETADLRRTNWIGSNTIAGEKINYPHKYKNRTNTPVTELNIVFRLAEQHLIKAEALAEQNKLEDAFKELNVIRKRAGLPELNSGDKQAFNSSMLKERMHEMFAEWGHLWFDLKRRNEVDDFKKIQQPNWQSYKRWLPIPQSQILYNIYLTQNIGYE